SWRQILASPRTCIGGFAFALGGFRNQDSLTWYNMNFGDLKRAGYWAVQEIFTGQKPAVAFPKVSLFTVEPSSGVAPGNRVELELRATAPDPAALTYDYFI